MNEGQIKHLEFLLLLNIISLPFVLYFYSNHNPISIGLLLFSDLAYIWLIDELVILERLKQIIKTKKYDSAMLRVIIYTVCLICLITLVGLKNNGLGLLLVGNLIILVVVDYYKERLVQLIIKR